MQPADLISSDPKNDLALLKSKSSKFFKYGKFRGAKKVEIGEDIAVIGFPLKGILSTGATATFGNINALRGLADDSSKMQISAPIQPGSSGGPVLDSNGNIIGAIVSSINDKFLYENLGAVPQNANFAINGSFIKNFLDVRDVYYESNEKINVTIQPIFFSVSKKSS